MTKVVVIGIDGGTFDLMAPWIEQGHMPVLSSLIEGGVSGELESTMPPFTCPAWWSFSTGKNPGRFGSYHFWQLEPESYEIKRSNRVYGPGNSLELWDILNSAGHRCGIINNPIMFSPARVDGYSVAGWFASKSNFTHPKSLKKVLDEVAGGYEIDFFIGEDKSDEEIVRNCKIFLEKRRKVICHLLADSDRPEFFLGVLTEPDRICHHLINKAIADNDLSRLSREMLLDFFKLLDSAIGDMVDTMDSSDYLFVISDHGFGPREKSFYINEWLLREGYLSLKRGTLKGRSGDRQMTDSSKRRIKSMLRNLAITDFIKSKVPRSMLERFASDSDAIEGEGSSIFDFIKDNLIDWKKTKAIALPDGLVYINTNERPEGIVTLGNEYESLRDELIEKLTSLADSESGKALGAKVYKKEEVYQGEFTGQAPDLLLEIDNYSVGVLANIKSSTELYGSLRLAGHRRNGMLIAKGRNIKEGVKINEARLIDMAPTMLHIMDVPVPEDMDGRVLRELFEEHSKLAEKNDDVQKAAYRERQSETQESPDEEEEVRKRLEELGYI